MTDHELTELLADDARAVERLAALLFRLARDSVPFGKIEEHLRAIEEAHGTERVTYVGVAHPMGEWARETAHRVLMVAASYITWEAKSETNELIYCHPHCDGRPKGARWVVPLDDIPLPLRGASEECANCCHVLSLRPAE